MQNYACIRKDKGRQFSYPLLNSPYDTTSRTEQAKAGYQELPLGSPSIEWQGHKTESSPADSPGMLAGI